MTDARSRSSLTTIMSEGNEEQEQEESPVQSEAEEKDEEDDTRSVTSAKSKKSNYEDDNDDQGDDGENGNDDDEENESVHSYKSEDAKSRTSDADDGKSIRSNKSTNSKVRDGDNVSVTSKKSRISVRDDISQKDDDQVSQKSYRSDDFESDHDSQDEGRKSVNSHKSNMSYMDEDEPETKSLTSQKYGSDREDEQEEDDGKSLRSQGSREEENTESLEVKRVRFSRAKSARVRRRNSETESNQGSRASIRSDKSYDSKRDEDTKSNGSYRPGSAQSNSSDKAEDEEDTKSVGSYRSNSKKEDDEKSVNSYHSRVSGSRASLSQNGDTGSVKSSNSRRSSRSSLKDTSESKDDQRSIYSTDSRISNSTQRSGSDNAENGEKVVKDGESTKSSSSLKSSQGQDKKQDGRSCRRSKDKSSSKDSEGKKIEKRQRLSKKSSSLSLQSQELNKHENEQQETVNGPSMTNTNIDTGTLSNQNTQNNSIRGKSKSKERRPSATSSTSDHSDKGKDNSSMKQDQFSQQQKQENTISHDAMTTDNLSMGDLRKMETLERIEDLKIALDNEYAQLKNVHFKEYEGIKQLQEKVNEVNDVCQEFNEFLEKMGQAMKNMRSSIGDIHYIIDKKLEDEGISSWIEGNRAEKTDYDAVATESKILSKAAEIRLLVAKSNQNVAEAQEKVTLLESEALEAADGATKAAKEAEDAIRRIEEAKKAEEAKQKAEEEERKRAEEEERKKEEEERKRKIEEARKQAELEKLAGTPEEIERLRKERERLDPKNWPKYVYSVDPGETDVAVGCVFRALTDSITRDEVTVESVSQLEGTLHLAWNEELVSHIIKVSAIDENDELQIEAPVAIAIPHFAPRNLTKEPMIKALQDDGSWEELGTYDVNFEDMREYKFVECRTTRLCTLAVVTRYKKEYHQIPRRGIKINPTVDQRICYTFNKGSVKKNTNVMLEVRPVDLSAVSELKLRHPEESSDFICCSSIVLYQMDCLEFLKPITVNIPMPPPQNKPKRPGTALPNGTAPTPPPRTLRPVSAMFTSSRNEDEAEEEVHLLKCEDGQWSRINDINLTQSKNRDFVTFDMEKKPLEKYIIVRSKLNADIQDLEKTVTILEKSISERTVQFILRQNGENPNEIILQCEPTNRMERFQRKLTEDGYDFGPPLSPPLIVKEGQIMTLKFRGNILDTEELDMAMCFNSYIRAMLTFQVREVDKYAQKSIDCYRGFVQLFTKEFVTKLVPKDDGKGDKNFSQQKNVPLHEIQVEENVLLCELLIRLPKPEPEPPKPIPRAPVTLKSDDAITDEVLHWLASELGEEWKIVGKHLNVRRGRIQAIMRNHINSEAEQVVYDMLTTWAKKIPRSINKADILANALTSAGRHDLAEDIKDRDLDFKKERAQSARDSNLRRAFIKVAQSSQVTNDWKYFARHLEVPEDSIEKIESEFKSMSERCFQSLLTWRRVTGSKATNHALVKHLRKCKFYQAADEANQVS